MSGRPKEFDPQQALATAQTLFWQQGFEATGMDQLLQHMQISRQSAYNTFGGKKALYLSTLKAYVLALSTELVKTLKNPAVSELGRILNFLDLIVARTASGSDRGCMLTNAIVELAPTHAEIRQLAGETLEGLENALSAALAAARESHEWKGRIKPREMARLIILVFQGAFVLSKSDRAATVTDGIGVLKTLLKPS